MTFAAVGLVLCGVGSASGEQVASIESVVQQRVDPGPKPRMEDFADLTEYLLALLKWLYALNGGNPADLDQASTRQSANLVASLYQKGLETQQARQRVVELAEASSFIAVMAISGPGSLFDREALLRASLSIDGAINVMNTGS